MKPKKKNNDPIINEEIRSNTVRVTNEDMEGVYPTKEAIKMAESNEEDLILINTNGKPPVCVIMELGKWQYEQKKKEKEKKKKQKEAAVDVKEIQLSPHIGDHDIDFKYRHAVKFLQDGDEVKIVMKMRGRQQQYSDDALEVINNFIEDLKEDVGIYIKQNPTREGNKFVAQAKKS